MWNAMRNGNSNWSNVGHFGGAAAAFSFGGDGFALASSLFRRTRARRGGRGCDRGLAPEPRVDVVALRRLAPRRLGASDAALLAAPSRSPATVDAVRAAR